MICNNCNKEIADGSAFCPECGATCTAPAANNGGAGVQDVMNKVKDTFNGLSENTKKGIKLGLAAVAAVLVLWFVIGLFDKGPFKLIKYDNKGYYWYASEEKMINVKGTIVEVDEGIADWNYSADYTLTVVEDEDDTLWFIDGKKLKEIDEEVFGYRISMYGDAIAYMKDVKDEIGDLYWFDVSKGKSVKVAGDVYCYNYVISPDGNHVAYIGECDIETVEDDWGYEYEELELGELYVSKKGKEGKEISKDAVPVAVSDGGKYVYYIKDGEKFYMNDEKIESGLDEDSRIYFTENCKEVLYTNEDGDTMYYRAKKDPVKVKGDSCGGPLTPGNVVCQYSSGAYIYAMDSFNESVINMGGDYYYMYKKGEEVDKIVSSGGYAVRMSEDGQSLVYIDDGDIKYVKKIKKNAKVKEIGGDDPEATGLVASKDLKEIYFRNEDGDICYAKKNKSVEVWDDDYEDILYSEKYECLYIVNEDNELFHVTKKGKASDVADDVVSVWSCGESVFYTDDDDADFKLKSKKKGKEFFED